eukprot:756169-Hanusia_phi.AAC.2
MRPEVREQAESYTKVKDLQKQKSEAEPVEILGKDKHAPAATRQTFLAFLERHLKQQPSRSELGSKVGILARTDPIWKAELDQAKGVKRLCIDNSHKFQYININGHEMVCLVDATSIQQGNNTVIQQSSTTTLKEGNTTTLRQGNAATIKQGDYVKIKQGIDAPSSGWRGVHSWSIGIVAKLNDTIVHVDFLEQKSWIGTTNDLEIVNPQEFAEFNRPPSELRFAKGKFVKSLIQGTLFQGVQANEDHHKKVGFVMAKQACDSNHSYFEVMLVKREPGNCYGSIVIGLSDKSYVPGRFVGESASGSIGMSDMGFLLFRTQRDLGSRQVLAEGGRIGCGIHFDKDGSKTVFFTVNGKETVRIPWTEDVHELYPVVCSSSENLLRIDLKVARPPFAPSCVLMSKHVEVFDSTINKWLKAIVVGPSTSSGTPVLIDGRPAMTFAQNLKISKDRTEVRLEFACLMWALRSSRDTDTILVKNNSPAEFCSSRIQILHTCSIAGEGADTNYCMYSDAANVIRVAAFEVKISSLNLSINFDSANERPEGQRFGIMLSSGCLKMKDVGVRCSYGSAVAVHSPFYDKQWRRFEMDDCKIGPCQGYGLAVNAMEREFLVKNSIFESCNAGAIRCNGVNGSILSCTFLQCGKGLVLERSNVEIKASMIKLCKDNAVNVYNNDDTAMFKVILDACVIEKSCRPILARGTNVHVLVTSCILKDCKKQVKEQKGATIEISCENDTAGPLKAAEDKLHTNDKKDNFKRFCKLLLGSGRDILAQVLQTCYMTSSKVSWSDGVGERIAEELDDYSQRKLGKALMTKLRSEAIESWDMTLLTSLLIFNPGYIKDEEGVAAVETLRTERNELAHSNILQDQEIENGEFKIRWNRVRLALETLVHLFLNQTDKNKLTTQIQRIADEKLCDSNMDTLLSPLETVQSQMKDVADQIQDLKMKADRAVTKSEVAHFVRECMGNPAAVRYVHEFPQRISLSNNQSYILQSNAGSGGMGTVYVACKEGSEERFTLKICNSSDEDRRDREAVILQKLESVKHPNLVRFLGSSYLDKHVIILMELVQGISLEVWLERKGYVSLSDSKLMMLQMADGMSAVHSHNIAHRDLKPNNLMVDDVTGNLVIVDFGLSKELNANMTVTPAKSFAGTAMYMSPEQLEGITSAVDLRSDVWAMGVICYEIVAGCTPFQQPSQDGSSKGSRNSSNLILSKADEMRIFHAILTKPVPELPTDTAPAPFQRVLRKALEKEGANRQVNANEFHKELAAAFAEIDEAQKSEPQASPSTTSIELLTVEEVSAVFRRCRFMEAAMAVESNGVDGKTYVSLDEKDLRSSIEDGGLGLKPMQVKRIKKEMEILFK